MAKRKQLYVVYAGFGDEPCTPVYETTKKSKAYDYLHNVVMKDQAYTKAYIDISTNYRASFYEPDKRYDE